MHILQEPIRWNFAPHPCLTCSRQHFAAHRGELQAEIGVVATAVDRIFTRDRQFSFTDAVGCQPPSS
jgi:hypothetical protein